MNSEERINNIVIKITEILFDNPDFFWISRSSREYAKKSLGVEEKDLETYLILSMQYKIGLRMIVRFMIQNLDSIRWNISPEASKNINNGIIKSILLECSGDYTPNKDQLEKFNNICKKYGIE